MTYRVEIAHWNANQGWTNTETFDNIEEYVTAEEYFNEAFGSANEAAGNDEGEAAEIRILDEDDNILSTYWVESEGPQKYTVKSEYLDKWTEEAVDELIVDENEIARLALEWDVPINDLMQQVEEV